MRLFIRTPMTTVFAVAAAGLFALATTSGAAFAQAAKQQQPAKQAAPQPPQAPAAKQIALTEKQLDGVVASQKDFDAVGNDEKAAKPSGKSTDKAGANVLAKLDDVSKKYGFANYADYTVVLDNIGLVIGGFDPKTKTYVGTQAVIKQQIAEIQADKKMPANEKKEALEELNQALKSPPPAVENKGNIDLVGKYYDKLSALFQDDEE